MIKIIDNLLPVGYIDAIEKLCYSEDMAWSYSSNSVYHLADNNLWDKQFSHVLFVNNKSASKHYNFFMPVMFALEHALGFKIKQLMRLKINLLTTVPDANTIFVPHIDAGDIEPYYSAVFYINNSDGDTIIYENAIHDRSVLGDINHYQEYLENKKKSEKFVVKQRVEYKKNRVVVFDGGYLHEAKWPERHKERIILNMVFR
jgi:hypothetical protein